MHTYYVGQIKTFLLNLLILLNSISMGKIYSVSNSANKAFRLSKIIAPLHIILCTYKHQSKARIHSNEKKNNKSSVEHNLYSQSHGEVTCFRLIN